MVAHPHSLQYPIERFFRRFGRAICVLLSVCSLLYCDAVFGLLARAEAQSAPVPAVVLPALPAAMGPLMQPAFQLQTVLKDLPGPVGIDHHPTHDKLVISVNYFTGMPHVLELVSRDGTREQFSSARGFLDEIKLATVKDTLGGFEPGALFCGNGKPGQIVRISPDGETVTNPWIVLPNEPGIFRGSLHMDRTGVFGGDLIAVTTRGGVWRINAERRAAILANVGEHLEGLTTIPDDPARYGPWAGKIVAGAETSGRFFTIDPAGHVENFQLGIIPEDIDLIPANENFYVVSFGTKELLGAPASAFAGMEGDILVTQEFPRRLFRVRWDGTQFVTQLLVELPFHQVNFEHATFSITGLGPIQPTSAPPTITCPEPVIAVADSPAGKSVTLTAQAADPDCEVLRVEWNVDGGPAEAVEEIPAHTAPSGGPSSFSFTYPPGTHRVTARVTDPFGSSAFCETTVTVVEDRTPPTVACTVAHPSLLWAPNHALVDVGLAVSAFDQGKSLPVTIRVFADEDDEEETGDGRFSPDALGLPAEAGSGQIPLLLRAERKGNADGRVYLIVATATDLAGNTGVGCCTVVVPKSNSQKHIDEANAQARAAEAACTASGSPTTPFIVGDGPILGPKQEAERALAAVIVTPVNPVLHLGTVQQFTATALYSDATREDVTSTATWTSSDASVATIDASGLAITLAVGTTTISATSGGLTGSTTLTVEPAPPPGGAPGAIGTIAIFPLTAKLLGGSKLNYEMGVASSHLSPVTPAPAPVAEWKGDGNALDSVGTNHGTLERGADFAIGHAGQAFQFDGDDDFVSIPDTALWTFPGDFSLEMRVEFDTVRAGAPDTLPNVLMAHDAGSGLADKWILLYAENAFFFHVGHAGAPGTFIGPFPFVVEPGQFHHVVLSRAGVTYRLHVDGRFIGAIDDATTIPDVAAPLTLGQAEGTGFLDGRLDEVRVYHQALATDEIRTRYAGVIALTSVARPVSAWPGESSFADTLGPNSGTPFGGVAFASGQLGSAFSFDGIDDFIGVRRAPLPSGFAQSVDAWIDPQVPSSDSGWVYSNRVGFQTEGFSLFVTNDGAIGLVARTTQDTRQFISAPGAVQFGRFQHVAVAAQSAERPRIYVDGTSVALSPGNLPGGLFVVPDNLEIGRRQGPDTPEGTAGVAAYNGLIDELHLFDRALTPPEVQTIFELGRLGLSPFVTWTSSHPGIASIGRLTGQVQALFGGGAVIIASSGNFSATAALEVLPRRAVQVELVPPTQELVVGHARQYHAFGLFNDCKVREITGTADWQTADVLVATARGDGFVVGVAPGSTVVSATLDGVTGTAIVSVVPRRLTEIVVNPVNALLITGRTLQYEATGTFNDGTTEDVTGEVVWTSADTNIAFIEGIGGQATGIAPGTVRIEALKDGITGFTLLNVQDRTLTALAVTPAEATIEAGRTVQLTATGTFNDGTVDDLTTQVTWTTSDGFVATVTVSGLVKGIATGVAGVTASKNGVSASSQITVTPAGLVSIRVEPPDQILETGDTLQYRAIGTLSDGRTQDVTSFSTWSTGNSAVATISSSGLATAVDTGTTSVAATVGTVVGSTGLRVILPVPLVSLTISPQDASLAQGLSLQYSLTGFFNDGSTRDLTFQAAWSSTNGAVAFIGSTGLAVALSEGTTTIVGSAKGQSASTSLTVLPPPPPPTVEIAFPVPDSVVTEMTAVTGSASAPYVLEFAPVDTGEFRTIATGDPVEGGFLGTFDPTLLENGIYTIRLTATDAARQRSSTEIQVIVEGAVKIGLFTLTFNDLTIPVHGVPITVNRVYDSRVKSQGDFGIGWRLELKTVKLQTNKKPGQGGWSLEPMDPTDAGGGFFIQLPGFILSSSQPHYVTARFQDGRTETFDFVGVSEPQLGTTFVLAPILRPRAGATSSMEALGAESLIAVDGDLLDFSFQVYDPQFFVLTAKDGTSFVVHKVEGVLRVSDTDGNRIDITPEGITSSAELEVIFERDGAGRISRIVDPENQELLYEYDSSGDLVATTDRQANVTTYTYVGNHFLQDIFDPLGRRPIKNVYDPDGRLVQTIDGDGNVITLNHDPANRTEEIFDRRGKRTLLVYDPRGNVLSQIRSVNGVTVTTSSTYDSIDNETSRTDELGNTTMFEYNRRRDVVTETRFLDGRAIVTRRSFNNFGQVLTQIDPLGRVTSNTYDGHGHLLTSTDGEGNTTQNFYDPIGRLISTLDPSGTATEFRHGRQGYVVEQQVRAATGEILRMSSFTYDLNGNQETRTEWLEVVPGFFAPYATTRTLHDANGRPIQQIDPQGRSTFTVYNAAGQQEATIDKNGSRTDFSYDNRGLLTRTEFPPVHVNGTLVRPTEIIEYDESGNRVAFTDRNGHRTQTLYDDLDRPFKVINPDSTFRLTEYDLAGRVSAEIDERSNRTQFRYDSLGRRVKTIDALLQETQFIYDDAGQQVGILDARGNTTQFVYDGAGRQVATIFPDGTRRSVAYDALGRRVAETDEAGITKRFDYAPTGELVAVRLPDPFDARRLSTVTQFGYDSLGRKLIQIDAEGRRTHWTYTNRGEVETRLLPGGQLERFSYTPSGQVDVHTRFDGSTISHQYDAQDRLTRKNFSRGGFEAYAYTAGGQRSVVNIGGDIWQFGYDNRNRPTSELKPDGQFIGYEYDGTGNRVRLRTALQDLTYVFDALNRPVGVRNTSETAFLATAGYDAVGNLSFRIYANNTQVVFDYNGKNQLTSVVNSHTGGTVISSYVYTVDATGKRTAVVENDGRTVGYGYDALGRLVSEQIQHPGGAQSLFSYGYDLVGNRLVKQSMRPDSSETVGYTYNANDELLTESSTVFGTKTYSYTANGETASISGPGGTQAFGWDQQSRLVAYAGPNGSGTIKYDTDGIRWLKTVGLSVTTFLVDRVQPFQQVLEDRVGGAVTATYVHLDDLVAAAFPGTGTRFYHYDGQMSTRKLTDSAAAVTDEYTFDAWGVTLASTGTTPNNYLYTGEQFDPNVGMQYNRARYLSLSSGTFVSHDPAAGAIEDPISLHRYLNAQGDPANKLDPTGLGVSLTELIVGIAIFNVLFSMVALAVAPQEGKNRTGLWTITGFLVVVLAQFGEFGAAVFGGVLIFTAATFRVSSAFVVLGFLLGTFRQDKTVSLMGAIKDIAGRAVGDVVVTEASMQRTMALLAGAIGEDLTRERGRPTGGAGVVTVNGFLFGIYDSQDFMTNMYGGIGFASIVRPYASMGLGGSGISALTPSFPFVQGNVTFGFVGVGFGATTGPGGVSFGFGGFLIIREAR
jgi:RHS repeat-associated protein